ncbi:gluconokinase [Thalassospira sp.]|uniref:gluconokinase n=1 Tax=Thalassospira sp. TaxID=1912094 RepID=UPI0027355644|nr:gluconokinase [Thalassospira sp.]MDP2699324.1 gluconokinase [Thalassospira sp.]
MNIVVMGVSGCGKTALSRMLSDRLRLPFIEGDDLHPPQNRARMSAGLPLDDRMRQPWLERIGAEMQQQSAGPGGCVVACSALKRHYRNILRRGGADVFVHLQARFEVIEARLQHRQGHFMPVSLLTNQYATLEPFDGDETDTILLDAERPVAALCYQACRGLVCDFHDIIGTGRALSENNG